MRGFQPFSRATPSDCTASWKLPGAGSTSSTPQYRRRGEGGKGRFAGRLRGGEQPKWSWLFCARCGGSGRWDKSRKGWRGQGGMTTRQVELSFTEGTEVLGGRGHGGGVTA